MAEKLLVGLVWGAVLGLGYYGIIYAIEYLRVRRYMKRTKP